MPAPFPQRTRVYRCHHLDSTRWDDVVPRPDDIIITTSLKAGTTWTQRIVSLLVFQTLDLPKTLHWVSPWPDARLKRWLEGGAASGVVPKERSG